MSVAPSREHRYCARKQECVWYRRGVEQALDAPQPGKLGESNPDDICEACRKVKLDAESEGPGPEEATTEEDRGLFRAARALFREGIDTERTIVATLVFAAMFDELPLLGEIRDAFAATAEGSEARRGLHKRFMKDFEPLEVRGIVDNTLLVGWPKIRAVCTHHRETSALEEITMYVVERPVKPERVARLYEEALSLYAATYDHPDQGVIMPRAGQRWMRIRIKPAGDGEDGSGQGSFPHPTVVQHTCQGLKSVFGSSPEGRGGGGPRDPSTLIPACVAWYIGERGRVMKDRELEPAVARTLNKHVLAPSNQDSLPERHWLSSHSIRHPLNNEAPGLIELTEDVIRMSPGVRFPLPG